MTQNPYLDEANGACVLSRKLGPLRRLYCLMQVRAVTSVQVTSTCNMALDSYPFDHQSCPIIFYNNRPFTRVVLDNFIVDMSGAMGKGQVNEWDLYDMFSSVEYTEQDVSVK